MREQGGCLGFGTGYFGFEASGVVLFALVRLGFGGVVTLIARGRTDGCLRFIQLMVLVD